VRETQDDILLEQRVCFGELFDLYSPLLTEKQRTACGLLLAGDLSVAEVGEELGMTRQGAYDLVRRSREALEEIEGHLRLREIKGRYEALSAAIRAAERDLPRDFFHSIAGLLAGEGARDV